MEEYMAGGQMSEESLKNQPVHFELLRVVVRSWPDEVRLEESDARVLAGLSGNDLLQALSFRGSIGTRETESWRVRVLACLALGYRSGRWAEDALVGQAQFDEVVVRLSVVKALGQIGSDRCLVHLIKMLHDEEFEVVEAAVDILKLNLPRRKLGPEVVRALCLFFEAGSGDLNGDEVLDLLKVLGRHGSGRAMRCLLKVLESETEDDMKVAVLTVIMCGLPRSFPTLKKAIPFPDHDLTELVIKVLLKRKDPLAFGALRACLYSHDDIDRQTLFDVRAFLESIEDRRGVRALLRRVKYLL
ncbi:hypothetical protein COY93_04940 [Candidatus Uhrbacteria bacterium CG_4_10_14_0_8_um_filter_58_22]|uniref:HEAT repeat domain-containing protein n=1 Tax=Candidatus Uhrbacteria bacterium CG_4_10_14_0_8_um_filter_58_22 TaxID=1975029 RepID=A0A2M7Q8M2_9BACT|nr:HEAT repeat domain-containing protein [Acidobacteriota bacterium]OIO52814.1 MAG: hypothetical protein AUJ19_00030 [Parcubacteria group bacterium CG1_02_58_44]PIY61635.1 MAG: hypothetical protein COY93_04940 [Candidatus Uhrbacteria bacterium CG_4_10_14_0_8_um_filter_58_22]